MPSFCSARIRCLFFAFEFTSSKEPVRRCLGEDQDEDHADKESRLLGVCSNAGIPNNANGKSSPKSLPDVTN